MPKKIHKWNNRVFPICDFFSDLLLFLVLGDLWHTLEAHHVINAPRARLGLTSGPLPGDDHSTPGASHPRCSCLLISSMLDFHGWCISWSRQTISNWNSRDRYTPLWRLFTKLAPLLWRKQLKKKAGTMLMFQQELCVGHPLFCVAHVFFLGGLHKLPVAFWSDCVEALFGHAATRRHLIPGYHSGSFETCFVQFSQDAPPADEVVKIILSNIDVGGICKILKDWSTSLSLSASFNNMCIICGHQ